MHINLNLKCYIHKFLYRLRHSFKHVDCKEGLRTTEATPVITEGRSSQRDRSSL